MAQRAGEAALDARGAPVMDKTELFRQALAVAQAQTALVDRIVQNIGRMS